MAKGCDWHKGWDQGGWYCANCHKELVHPITDPEARKLFMRMARLLRSLAAAPGDDAPPALYQLGADVWNWIAVHGTGCEDDMPKGVIDARTGKSRRL